MTESPREGDVMLVPQLVPKSAVSCLLVVVQFFRFGSTGFLFFFSHVGIKMEDLEMAFPRQFDQLSQCLVTIIYVVCHLDTALYAVILEVRIVTMQFVKGMERQAQRLVDDCGGESLQVIVEQDDMLKFFRGEMFVRTILVRFTLPPTGMVARCVEFRFFSFSYYVCCKNVTMRQI